MPLLGKASGLELGFDVVLVPVPVLGKVLDPPPPPLPPRFGSVGVLPELGVDPGPVPPVLGAEVGGELVGGALELPTLGGALRQTRKVSEIGRHGQRYEAIHTH